MIPMIRPILTISFLINFILMGVWVSPPSEAQSIHKKAPPPMEKRVTDLEAAVTKLKEGFDTFTLKGLPETILLCDRKIPITREDIRERFEREFFQFLENRGLMTIIAKRYYKYLPMVTEEVKKASLPQDLIYLMAVESYFNPRSLSKANAAGLWQFIKETGKKEGLFINDIIDERYNMKKSTRSAVAHLKRLYGEFGDWMLALAAYNAGAARVREAIEYQNTKDFFDLFLPEETERYVFRIAAIKEILQNREKYGITFDEKEMYSPIYLVEVSVEASKDFYTSILADCMEIPYRTFRIFNLHLRRYVLPKGVYHINIPQDRYETFKKKLGNYPFIEIIRKAEGGK
ncbi:MAG: transglycosylase SLT domain-containing protein [Syntrophorhabdaceae bacterium]|nr:transglycosylase SLT domain-containing protein [Syntrophorhabdaceae bacterium]